MKFASLFSITSVLSHPLVRIRGMDTTVWDGVKIPTSDPSITTRVHAAAALRQLERLRREVDAASAGVTIVLGANSRDTAAGSPGLPVNQTVKPVEHVLMLHPLLGVPGVEDLLKKAARSTVDEFRETVQQFELDARGDEDMVDKQRKRRMLRLFDADLGMIGLTGLLPPIEGALLRAELESIADRAYRAKHPERAKERGGHHEEPLAARLADALVSLVGTGVGMNHQPRARRHRVEPQS